jgi:hypothetical protein
MPPEDFENPSDSAGSSLGQDPGMSGGSMSEPSAPVSQPSGTDSGAAGGGFSTPYEAFRHIPDFQGKDDLAIAQDLYRAHTERQELARQLSQYQSLIPAVQEYLPHQREFQAWRQSQAEAARPKAPEQPKWWNPPKVEDSWKSYIVRDPQTGREVISPDAPYEAQQALRSYQSYTADFVRRFASDPESTLKPFVEQVAVQKAQEMVQNHLNQYATTNYVQDLNRQNSDWLYENKNGQQQISQAGQAVQHYIQEAASMGIQSAQDRWRYATGSLQRDLLAMQYQRATSGQGVPQQFAPQQAGQQIPQAPAGVQQADAAAARDMQFLRERATRAPNRSGGTTEPQAPARRQSFNDRLRSQLEHDGVV